MKQTIKVKVLSKGCLPVVSKDGDWIDLRAADNINLDSPYAVARARKGGESTRKVVFPTTNIPLGVAMELPAGMEAVAAPRSSSNKKFHIIQSNSPGVVDNIYKGDDDQWHMPVLATGKVEIHKGDRICQFRIQPSQHATFWQKLKWLLSSGVEIKEVEQLGNPNRGGLGHSGVK